MAKAFMKDAEFKSTSSSIYSFTPFRLRIESKEVFISLGKVCGFVTAVWRRVNYENPSRHKIHFLYVAKKLKNGKFSDSWKRICMDDILHEDATSFFEQMEGTEEKIFADEIFTEAHEQFKAEEHRRCYTGVGGGSFERMCRIYGSPRALANCRSSTEAAVETRTYTAPQKTPQELKQIEQLEHQIRRDKRERDSYGNDSPWIEQRYINRNQAKLNELKRN